MSFVSLLTKIAVPFTHAEDLDGLAKTLSTAKIVLLGESSHGTRDFYHWRAVLTKTLVKDYGYNFVAAEADWPPSMEVNKFVMGRKETQDTKEVLRSNYTRWPTWMWSNENMEEFIDWLRKYNESLKAEEKCGFYGFDVYSLFESMDRVLTLLEEIDHELAENARNRYACFDPYQSDEKSYLRSLSSIPEGCRKQAVTELKELLQIALKEKETGEDLFDAIQNARIVQNAESYYHTMIDGNEDSWNVRDRHMTDTLMALLDRYGPNSKGIVWAHNTHVGDYRATSMVEEGQVNVGGLIREKLGKENVQIVGFSTYKGSVIASHKWGGLIDVMQVPQGRPGSVEADCHEICRKCTISRFIVSFDQLSEEERKIIDKDRGHRAIGVVYHPEVERYGNYVRTKLSQRYDHFIFIDTTQALKPLTPPKRKLNESK